MGVAPVGGPQGAATRGKTQHRPADTLGGPVRFQCHHLGFASSVEHIIKKMDGTIGQRNTYPRGRDPRSSKG